MRDRETPEVIGPLPLDIPLLREKPVGRGAAEISKVGPRPETLGIPLRDREKPKVIGPLPLDIPLLREKPGRRRR